MGGGFYSISDCFVRSVSKGYETKSANEIFTEKRLSSDMNPFGVKIRESRDSQEHPNSVAIILALDVTGSMGHIPHELIRKGLPTIMGSIIEAGIADPQLLFLAIGDHVWDDAPLQVAQFESNDELLDKWLTSIYLEGGGGGNGGESYSLAHYFAAMHTSIDCFEKRGQKGFLFTIGDEPTLKSYPASVIKGIMGESEARDYTATELLEEAQKTYNVYHLHVKKGSNGENPKVMNGWKEILGDNLIIVEESEDIPKIIASIVYKTVQHNSPNINQAFNVESNQVIPEGDTTDNGIQML